MELDRYHVGDVLGVGAFATVYEGTDPRLQSPVAIKVLADNWSQDPDVRFRFGQEAALLRRVKNEHRSAPLIDVFDIDEAPGSRPYFVMTYANGGTLEERLAKDRKLSIAELVRVIDTLGEGMAALHRNGVVHRDLKPSNLLYAMSAGDRDREQLLIGDLGLAKDQLTSNSALTLAGGSLGYMAPEQQVASSSITAQADIYSASVIVQEALSDTHIPPDLKHLEPKMAKVLEKGTSINSADRHESAELWASELKEAMHEPTSALADTRPKSRRGAMAIGAALLAIVVFGGAFLAWSGLSGSRMISIDGPLTAMVGESVVFLADVPEDGTHTWVVGDQRLSDDELLITPRGVGTLEVRLEHRASDGGIVEAVHLLEVGP